MYHIIYISLLICVAILKKFYLVSGIAIFTRFLFLDDLKSKSNDTKFEITDNK